METSKLEHIVQAIGRAEDWFFSYCANRNRNMTYVFKTCIIFFFGTFIPGYVFMVIEGSNEVPIYPYNLTPHRIHLIKELYAIDENQLTEDEFHVVAGHLVEEYREKVIIYTEVTDFIKDHDGFQLWTLWNSIGYAATVYTTLGYGELTPNTYVGRTLTIIYALVGIPLFLIALSDFGRFITVFVKVSWSYVRRLYYTGSFRKRKKTLEIGVLSQFDEKDSNVMGQNSEETPTTLDMSTFDLEEEHVLPVSLIILIFTVYTVMASLVYARWEGWTFFESFYFVFISLSTIGFGDFIPRKRFCIVLSIFVIFAGLAICTMLVDAIMESVEARFRPEDEGEAANDYDMSDEDSVSSLGPSDILDHAYDASIMKIINQEDEEEAKLGIKRSRSRLHALSKLLLFNENIDDDILDADNNIKKQKPVEEIELHQIDYLAETSNNSKEDTNIEVEKVTTKVEGPIHNKKVKEKQGKMEYLKNLALKRFKHRK